MMRRRMPVLVVAAALVASVSACTASWGDRVYQPTTGCVPAPMTASPEIVAPGQTVTLSARAVACDLELPAHTVFELRLQPSGDRTPFAVTEAELQEDGAFETSIVVPDDMPPGQATVYLVNYEVVDWCPGYSMPLAAASVVEASCAGYEAYVTVSEG